MLNNNHDDDIAARPVLLNQPATTLSVDADSKPSRGEAEEAVRVLLRWAGDDCKREGLLDTPPRVARSYQEFFRVMR